MIMSTLRRLLMAANQGSKYPANATVWEVTIPEGGASYLFYTQNANGAVVDWGDGTVETISGGGEKLPTHNYLAGKYRVVFTGTYNRCATGNYNGNNGKYVTAIIQVSEYLTNWANLLSGAAMTVLPSWFTIPDGVTSVAGLLFASSVESLPNSFSFGNTVTTVRDFAYNSKLASIPATLKLPKSCTNFGYVFGNLANLSVDVGFFLQDIPSSGTLNSEYAFGKCAAAHGTAPADKLWNNPNITWSSVLNCFIDCRNISNYSEIPAAWGGGGA
jgi:hypothetical protein